MPPFASNLPMSNSGPSNSGILRKASTRTRQQKSLKRKSPVGLTTRKRASNIIPKQIQRGSNQAMMNRRDLLKAGVGAVPLLAGNVVLSESALAHAAAAEGLAQ